MVWIGREKERPAGVAEEVQGSKGRLRWRRRENRTEEEM